MATNKGYTVKQLMEFCQEEIKNGNGDKHVQISRDDEGNGFHSLFYGFIAKKEDLEYYLNEGMFESFNIDSVDDIIILG